MSLSLLYLVVLDNIYVFVHVCYNLYCTVYSVNYLFIVYEILILCVNGQFVLYCKY